VAKLELTGVGDAHGGPDIVIVIARAPRGASTGAPASIVVGEEPLAVAPTPAMAATNAWADGARGASAGWMVTSTPKWWSLSIWPSLDTTKVDVQSGPWRS